MTLTRRLRQAGFPVVLLGIFALLVVQSRSSSSATTSSALSSLERLPTVEAGGHCMLSPLSVEERAGESSIILEGEVVARHSYWDSRHHNIYTANLVNVYKVFKGNVSGGQVEIITEGGTVGLEKQITTPSLELRNGDMGVFFGESTQFIDPHKQISAPSYEAYGSVQGFIRYSLSDGTASEPFRKYAGIETEVYNTITSITGTAPLELAENSRLVQSHDKGDLSPNAVPTITSFSPTITAGGRDLVLTITGTNFGAVRGTGFVEFKASDDGGATWVEPIASEYTSWSDTEIKVMVPSGGPGGMNGAAGTGTIRVTNSDPATVESTGTLTIDYSYTNVGDDGSDDTLTRISQMPDHVDDNGAGGYTFTMDTGEFTPTDADDSFTRAMNTWTCAAGMNWTTTTGAIDVIASDGTNAVRFDDDAELPGGVLGRATSRYTGCGPATPPDTYLTWSIFEIDVAFDDGTTWEFGPALPSAGEYDFETVSLHELGHGHQLGHVISTGAVMHYALADGTSARVLGAADEAGGRYIMSRSLVANACGSGAMTKAVGVGCLPTAAPATIEGNVSLADGTPLAGVTIRMGGMQNRLMITDAEGKYRFDNVDVEQFYTITPERINYHFNPGSRSYSLQANITDAVFTASPDAVIVGNAIDTSEYFVRQHYLDFLNREPDESGFAFWNDQIDSCGDDASCVERKRINVSAAYFLSIEFQNTGGLVDGLYRASFGRAPKYVEFMPDAATMAQNVVVGRGDWEGQLRSNKEAFVDSFVNRSSFKAVHDGLSNAAYVDRLISNTGVPFSGGERDALVNSLSNGSTRGDVLLRVAEHEGFVQAKRNAAFVLMEYFGYLRRDPDESGYQYWLNKLNQFDGNFERAEMVKAFISSDEYRSRFQR